MKLLHPTAGKGTITSDYKNPRKNHFGIDIGVSIGTPIIAIDNGEIVYSGNRDAKGYGKEIVLKTKKGLFARYAHLNTINVKSGDKVKAGQIIGQVGNSGYSTGPHLHFEINKTEGFPGTKPEISVDPKKVIDFKSPFKGEIFGRDDIKYVSGNTPFKTQNDNVEIISSMLNLFKALTN
jgi:murein DD-endopeptidase MepM/ murein hydrolase activator NlpD